MTSVKLIRTKFLIPISEKIGLKTRIKDGYVLLEGNSIKEVGKYSESIGKKILNGNKNNTEFLIVGSNKRENYTLNDIIQLNGVALPGFIKCHGHDHESPLIGVARDVPLTTWLDEAINPFTGFMNDNYDELNEKLDESPYYITYLKARLDDISYGITTALTHHCNFNKYHASELVRANDVAGTRIFIGIGSQDRHYYEKILDKVDEAIKRLDDYHEKHKTNDRATIIPGPDQFFSNGPELLKALKKWARDHNTLFHIHSSEEPGTTKWFVETYGMTPVEYGNSIGILDENSILAHQVNSTENDLKILQETGAKIVHNPLANTILGSGMPPIIKMRKMGIPIAISTDGSGSADCQNILSAARLASQYQKAINQDAKLLPAMEVLQLITIEGAKLLKVNKGSLEPGKDADLIVVDLDYPNLTPTRLETVVENLIWASSGNEISYVIANGKILVDDYDFTTINREELLYKVQLLAEMFGEYKKTAEKISGTGTHK
ncbi:MAG: Atrazine chlorohydrolase [Candidatus Heimdallarchaeota archaeon LC_3]|nr:MAG: Atrazine chlorohydrolase [Candidatus Heimdallarchaeota archaeon LC_3]